MVEIKPSEFTIGDVEGLQMKMFTLQEIRANLVMAPSRYTSFKAYVTGRGEEEQTSNGISKVV